MKNSRSEASKRRNNNKSEQTQKRAMLRERSVPVRDTEENVTDVRPVITRRRRTVQELFDAQQRLKALMHALPVGVSFSSNATCQSITENPTVLAQFEVLPEDNLSASAPDSRTLGRRVRFFHEGREISDAELPLQQAVAENREIPPMEVEVELPSGKRWFTEASGAPIRDSQGKVVGGVAVTVDITERKRAEEALRENEENYRNLVEHSLQGTFVIQDMRIVFSNQAFADMGGYTLEELYSLSPEQVMNLIHPDDREKVWGQYRERLEGHILPPASRELRALRKDGSIAWVEYAGFRITYSGRPALQISIVDTTQRREAESALRESEQRWAATVASIGDAVLATDVAGRITFMNITAETLTGWTLMDAAVKPVTQIFKIIDEQTRCEVENPVTKVLREGVMVGVSGHTILVRKDGTEVPIDDSGAPIRDADGTIMGVVLVFRDITERRQTDERIRAALKEKEVLLQEIHHRVKNNLQLISSLLYLQASTTEHPGAISALRESRARIKSIALIHERLYATPDLSSIDMGWYTEGLVTDLHQSYKTKHDSVRLKLDIGDIRLCVNQAIPCGLIMNELVSNAFKHAFPADREGEVTVRLTRGGSDSIALIVSDNGIGFPEHVDYRESPSLGLTLVNSLVEQLDATFELDRSGGTSFTVTFRQSAERDRPSFIR